MSEDKISGLQKPSRESTLLLSPEGRIFEQVYRSPKSEILPDYVTLNKDSTFLCPNGNAYVYKQVREKGDLVVRDELLKTCYCSCSSVCSPPCLVSEYLNHSYLPVTEVAHRFYCKNSVERGPGNLYTNFPSV